MSKVFHSYHLVSVSPWPLLVGFNVMVLFLGMVDIFKFQDSVLFYMSLFVLMFVVIMWWRDVVRESFFEGVHCVYVVSGLMLGMILFIISEVFFFLSFFWGFFHSSLSPAVELGVQWPPCGILTFSPFSIPLLNTIILLSSGVSVTWVHQMLLYKGKMYGQYGLLLTVILGVYFLMLQLFEYSSAMFDISDSVYGSVFFVATGFHGLHVMVGTGFLLVMLFRMINSHFSNNHHFGFEAAAWYWHFVDVVWLLLFCMVYWWGS